MSSQKPSCFTCKKYSNCGYRLASKCSCCIFYDEKPINPNDYLESNETFKNIMDMFKMKK